MAIESLEIEFETCINSILPFISTIPSTTSTHFLLTLGIPFQVWLASEATEQGESMTGVGPLVAAGGDNTLGMAPLLGSGGRRLRDPEDIWKDEVEQEVEVEHVLRLPSKGDSEIDFWN